MQGCRSITIGGTERRHINFGWIGPVATTFVFVFVFVVVFVFFTRTRFSFTFTRCANTRIAFTRGSSVRLRNGLSCATRYSPDTTHGLTGSLSPTKSAGFNGTGVSILLTVIYRIFVVHRQSIHTHVCSGGLSIIDGKPINHASYFAIYWIHTIRIVLHNVGFRKS